MRERTESVSWLEAALARLPTPIPSEQWPGSAYTSAERAGSAPKSAEPLTVAGPHRIHTGFRMTPFAVMWEPTYSARRRGARTTESSADRLLVIGQIRPRSKSWWSLLRPVQKEVYTVSEYAPSGAALSRQRLNAPGACAHTPGPAEFPDVGVSRVGVRSRSRPGGEWTPGIGRISFSRSSEPAVPLADAVGLAELLRDAVDRV